MKYHELIPQINIEGIISRHKDNELVRLRSEASSLENQLKKERAKQTYVPKRQPRPATPRYKRKKKPLGIWPVASKVLIGAGIILSVWGSYKGAKYGLEKLAQYTVENERKELVQNNHVNTVPELPSNVEIVPDKVNETRKPKSNARYVPTPIPLPDDSENEVIDYNEWYEYGERPDSPVEEAVQFFGNPRTLPLEMPFSRLPSKVRKLFNSNNGYNDKVLKVYKCDITDDMIDEFIIISKRKNIGMHDSVYYTLSMDIFENEFLYSWKTDHYKIKSNYKLAYGSEMHGETIKDVKFINLNNDHEKEIIIFAHYGSNKDFENYNLDGTRYIHSTIISGGFRNYSAHSPKNSFVFRDMNSSLIDLDEDGITEIILQDLSENVRTNGWTARFPDSEQYLTKIDKRSIHHWDGEKLVDVSSQFPEYFTFHFFNEKDHMDCGRYNGNNALMCEEHKKQSIAWARKFAAGAR
ncbi:hypothetical protein ACFL6I_21215 [candidate division KSB1 bacterium]